MVMIAPLS